jgi:aminoglycoside 6-adenylyltransferase
MMGWHIGLEHGYTFSLGKNYKFIDRYLPAQDWEDLLSTYRGNGYPEMWRSLFTCYRLFRSCSKALAEQLGYKYPNYDEAVSRYTDTIYRSLK